MEKVCSNLTAIVAGTPRQQNTRAVTEYLKRSNIPYQLCEDIYSAAAKISASRGLDPLIVIACFSILSGEEMRLFSLTPGNTKIIFCCLIKKWSDYMRPKLLEAARNGVFILNSVHEIKEIIEKNRGAVAVAALKKSNNKDFATRIADIADNFFLSQAETDALLGVEYGSNK